MDVRGDQTDAERFDAHAARAASEEQYRLAVDAARIGTWCRNSVSERGMTHGGAVGSSGGKDVKQVAGQLFRYDAMRDVSLSA